MHPITVYAHRGFSAVAPENTMVAFRKAAEAGAHGLELDVHFTRDDQIVVIHDETVKRTTDGKGKVRELTLEEIRRLDAGSWFDGEFRGEKIPLLSEVLELVADRGLSVNIELKNNKTAYPGLEEAVLEWIGRFGLVDRTVISSFNHYSLRKIRDLRPEVDAAILYMANLFEPWNYARNVGATSIHSYWPTTVEDMVKRSKEAGVPVRPFTVNQTKEMRRMIHLEVDAIITDKVDRLLKEIRDAKECHSTSCGIGTPGEAG
ncbi:glycerophosphodiester phosphodiesterase [Salinithrix halophila]|uniref:Glycerophosphodiester phosphodiesterase n=1 Tax=Salinithrix halophila TaxID=1485204 RepID=A0ABV8JH77_9BACL